jgi:putative membrane protein
MWFKAFHLIAVIAWMAGMLYLPRLYAYHADVAIGSEADKIFQTMERNLLRIIINPAMVVTFGLGIILMLIYGMHNLGGWFHMKFTLVLIMAGFHGIFAKWRKDFSLGKNKHSSKFYRIVNEVPAILMIAIVILVIVKPFE